MKTTRFLASLVIATSLSTAAFAEVSAKTEQFINKATMGDQFEIDTSKVALDRSKDGEVRAFATDMIKDHMHTKETLKAAVPSDSYPESTKLDAAHQEQLDMLREVPADQFDAAYVKAQIKAHDEAVAAFSDYAAKGDEPELKGFASNALPRLKQHQAHVKSFKKTDDGYHASAMMPRSVEPVAMPGEKPMAVQR